MPRHRGTDFMCLSVRKIQYLPLDGAQTFPSGSILLGNFVGLQSELQSLNLLTPWFRGKLRLPIMK
jgi:hypothetical protein